MQTPRQHKKIGLLGGTFDPVHNGHLAVAAQALKTLKLDGVWFIPAAAPPHKPGHGDNREISGFRHRLAMLNKATAGHGSFSVSDIEAKRKEPSYSIDTIRILADSAGEQTDFSFIIGSDAFLEIDTWKRYQELPTLVNLVIVPRPGFPPDRVRQVIHENYPDFISDPGREVWSSPKAGGIIKLLPMKPVPISSTEIRAKVRRGEDISGLVPSAVAEYIRKAKLYV